MDTDTTREINRNRDIDIDTNMDKDMLHGHGPATTFRRLPTPESKLPQ
jgi:hypothetical protein